MTIKKRILFISVLFFFSTLSHAETTIRLTNGEWEPCMGEHCPHYGLSSHIVTEAFKLVGINVKWSFFPWKRLENTTNKRRNEGGEKQYLITGNQWTVAQHSRCGSGMSVIESLGDEGILPL